MKSIDSIAALRLVSKAVDTRVFLYGYYVPGDGGGGHYHYDPADTTSADDGGAVIVANDGGRWKLVHEGEVYAEQFGAKGDFNEATKTGTDNTTAFAKAVAYLASKGGGVMKIGAGKFMGHIRITTPNIHIEGQGVWTTTLFNAGNSPIYHIDGRTKVISDCSLKHLALQTRDKWVYQGSDGIFIEGPGGDTNGSIFLEFDDLYILSMQHGINMIGRSIWNTWRNIHVADSIYNGLNVDANDNIAQQLWEGCRFAICGQHGMFLSHSFAAFPTVGWTFVGCTFERNMLNGIRVTGSTAGIQAWKFIDCYFEENTHNIVKGNTSLRKAHFFCDVPNVYSLDFDGGSMFGESPGDPSMDYHIYVETNPSRIYVGGVRNMRFGIASVADIYWQKGVTVGQNMFSAGYNSDASQGSFLLPEYVKPSTTFTPTLNFNGSPAGIGYNYRVGQYVRHGNIVHFTLYVAINTKGAGSGAATISGLPVAALSGVNFFQAVPVQANQFQASVPVVEARIIPGTTSIELTKFIGGVGDPLTHADFGNFSALAISGTYIVS